MFALRNLKNINKCKPFELFLLAAELIADAINLLLIITKIKLPPP